MYRRALSALAPLSLTTQVPDQRTFTGSTPEWSDSEEPAQKVTGGTPVINRLALGLLFSTAVFRTLPINPPGVGVSFHPYYPKTFVFFLHSGVGSHFLIIATAIMLMALLGMFNVHRHGAINSAAILLYALSSCESRAPRIVP